jgi:DNA-binding SARP family transcriptional activator
VQDGAFRLITLGRLTLLRPDGSEEESLATRRRKLALLTVLALAPRPLARDYLVEMFWGDQEEERARHSLSDALSHVRRVLGRDAITMHRADVALSDDVPLVVDARELMAAARDPARVVALYGGDFLAQVYAAPSSTYEQWVDGQRDRLQRIFLGACAHRCAALAGESRWDECSALAARWVEAAPLSGEAAAALVAAIAAPGTREALGRALAAYERLTMRLAKEFAAPPDARVAAVARTIGERLARSGPPTAPRPAAAAPAAIAPAAPHPPDPSAPAPPAATAPPAPAVAPSAADLDSRPSWHERLTRVAPGRRPLRSAVRPAAGVALVAGAVLALAWSARYTRPTAAFAGDASRAIAVLPFRVGAADSSLAYLREGMVDLLDAKLTGEVGPRSVDPRAVMSAWRHAGADGSTDLASSAALRVARALGAGQLLVGNVIGTPEHMVLSASIISVAGGEVRGYATAQGPVDSLTALTDRLVAGLLATDAGEEGRRLADLSSTSLPALQAYLAGRVAYRAGRAAEAIVHYRRALDLDPAFALAEFGLAAPGGWTAERASEPAGRRRDRVRALRQRLKPRDAALFTAYIGLAYPALRAGAEELADWERAARAAPDSPEAWYELGDRLFHVGSALGISDAERQAGAALSQAVALDSGFALPLAHLVELAARSGDATRMRHLAALYFALDPTSPTRDYMRWRVADAVGDVGEIARLRDEIPRASTASLERIVGVEQLEGNRSVLAEPAVTELQARAVTTHARLLAQTAAHQLALNRGRPGAALETLRLLREIEPFPLGFFYGSRGADQLAIADALFGDGDPAAATAAARALSARAEAPVSPDAAIRARQYTDLCTLELWHLAHGPSASAPRSIARLRRARAHAEGASLDQWSTTLCIPMLDALHQATAAGPGARAAVEGLDSLMATWPAGYGAEFGNLVVARLVERQGDHAGALAALRRRPFYWVPGPRYLSTFLREEGRLAALAGDLAGARHAYGRYLALRQDPDPALRADAERARAELRRIAGPVR